MLTEDDLAEINLLIEAQYVEEAEEGATEEGEEPGQNEEGALNEETAQEGAEVE